MTTEDLLTDLRASRTDLARFVEAASRETLPYIVVSARSVQAWEQREPHTWAKVRAWLTVHSKAVVQV